MVTLFSSRHNICKQKRKLGNWMLRAEWLKGSERFKNQTLQPYCADNQRETRGAEGFEGFFEGKIAYIWSGLECQSSKK